MSINETLLVLGAADDGRMLTSEEFADAVYEEPWRYERVEGRLLVIAADGQRHHNGSRPWRNQFGGYWYLHPEVVEDLVMNAWVRIDDGTDRIGDIGVYLVADGEVAKIPDRVPELMYKVGTPDKKSVHRDYFEKREEYHRLGIKEYVIADRFTRLLTVLEHEPGGYRERTLTPDDIYTTPLLPGLAIPLADVL